jgi:ATP-binding protein involved in chromosome partitioning
MSQKPAIPGIKHIIAVASGKGGVGKSTVAANLALALAAEGQRVGMLDADIYGPSQPRMLGAQRQQLESPDGKRPNPVLAHGLQTMSIGYLVEEDTAMIWRGPMVTQALHQLLHDTLWDNIDVMVVDLPPGTGDIHLSLVQKIPLSGAVIVTTPQDIALLDARKGLRMFQKVNVPVLGVVENMSTHVCTQCGHEEPIFGSEGGANLARDEGIDLLGQIPLDIKVREQADAGRPTVVAAPDSDIAQRYRNIARQVIEKLTATGTGPGFPKIVIEDN